MAKKAVKRKPAGRKKKPTGPRGAITMLGFNPFEADLLVTEAVLTKKRIKADWKQDRDLWHLDATSNDGGFTYKGAFGLGGTESGNSIELHAYRRRVGEVLMVGTWVQRSLGNEGGLLLSLVPPEV